LDPATGRNLFSDPQGDFAMSETFRQFVAGIVALAPEALPMSHHTVNSYRRIAPGNWAPKTASWAVQNYSAGIRVVPQPERRCRLEYRLPGSDTNPYLTLAFLLGAGLHGIETKAELPPPLEGGGPDAGAEGAPLLPHDLYVATDALDRSGTARKIFGDAFIDHFVASRRVEEAALRQAVSNAERSRYLEVV
jgi:glutamine synthetase